jgi:tetraacyldisaccharide 4'-kinase
VLDDGFQHLRLARDLNIVTIDATNPWGGGRLLPYGRLRENPEGLSRADCVVITRCDQASDVEALEAEIARLIDDRPIFRSQMRPVRVVWLKNHSETLAPPATIAAFCAVGNPGSFFENLRRMGFEMALQRSFPDHHVYSQAEIDALVKDAGANVLVTTAKDAVKLRTLSFAVPCYVMEIEIAIENADEFTRLIADAAER